MIDEKEEVVKSLGDWIAHDVITVAKVMEGDKTLEDLGIMELAPGTHIVKCRDAVNINPSRLAEWDEQSVEWILGMYQEGKLLRDCDHEAMTLIDCQERDELIRGMWLFIQSACGKYPKLFEPPTQGGQMVYPHPLDDFKRRIEDLGIEA